MSALLGLLANPRLLLALGAAVVALGLGGYVWTLRSQNASLTAANATLEMQRDEAVRIGNRNAEEAKRQAEEFQRQAAATRAERDAERKRAVSLTQTLEEIARAPKEDNGPVAPVLARVFERLSRQPAAAADGTEGRADQAARGAADVPSRAANPAKAKGSGRSR